MNKKLDRIQMMELVPFQTDGMIEAYAMDQWLDHLDSLATVLSQRRMTEDQRERLFGLLERIYTDARTRRRPKRKAA